MLQDCVGCTRFSASLVWRAENRGSRKNLSLTFSLVAEGIDREAVQGHQIFHRDAASGVATGQRIHDSLSSLCGPLSDHLLPHVEIGLTHAAVGGVHPRV